MGNHLNHGQTRLILGGESRTVMSGNGRLPWGGYRALDDRDETLIVDSIGEAAGVE